MNIVILAAGQGKRMHSNLPKVLQPVAGRPLLGHVLQTARLLSAHKICVVYGHGGDMVRGQFCDTAIEWAHQAEQLGTGHAVKQALPLLDEASISLILYGDVPLIQTETLKQLVSKANDALAVLTIEMPNPTGYGRIVRDAMGRVASIVEEKDAAPEIRVINEVNTGIMAMPTHLLSKWLGKLSNNNAQREYYLTDIVGMAVQEGINVATTHPQFDWEVMGVNSKVELARLERLYQRHCAENLMTQGVRLADPDRIDVRGTLSCGRDVFIDVNSVFEGDVVLGDAVEIGPNCVIKNATIFTGTRIAAFSHIDGAKIGADAVIGPFARLRPGTELAESVHVGNFVEIKKSKIAAYSKANHLSYIGDAEVGSRVNVGAGTITCNYDGVNKFQTVIEDDVFIGSDTQLVAPVRVGRGATLGAGTTLTKDAPPETLTISRAKQVSLKSWKRPEKIKK